MNTKLYVGNLSFDTSESDLKTLFSEAGAVNEVALINDKMTGRSRGFAFVTMSNSDGASEAISKFSGTEFQGRNLTVNEAKDRESSGGGAGGRGAGGGDRRPARRF